MAESTQPGVVVLPIGGKDVPFLAVPFTTTLRRSDALLGVVQVPVLVPLSGLTDPDGIAAYLREYADTIIAQMKLYNAVIDKLAHSPLQPLPMAADDLT